MAQCKITGFKTGLQIEQSGLSIDDDIFFSTGFKEIFGDWENFTPSEEDISLRLNIEEDGKGYSPKLIFNKSRTQAFVLDKNFNKVPISNIRYKSLPRDKAEKISYEAVQALTDIIINEELVYSFGEVDNNGIYDIDLLYNDAVEDLLDLNVLSETIINSFKADAATYKKDILLELKRRGFIYKKGNLEEVAKIEEENKEKIKELELQGATEEDIEKAVEFMESSGPIKQRPAFERDTKDKASPEIKMLLSTIPEYTVDKLTNVKTVSSYEYFPGATKSMDSSKVWAILLQHFADIPYGENSEGKQRGTTKQILNKLIEPSFVQKYPWAEELYSSITGVSEELADQRALQFTMAMRNVKNRLITFEKTALDGIKIMDTTDSSMNKRLFIAEIADQLRAGEDISDNTLMEEAKESSAKAALKSINDEKLIRSVFVKNDLENNLSPTEVLESMANEEFHKDTVSLFNSYSELLENNLGIAITLNDLAVGLSNRDKGKELTGLEFGSYIEVFLSNIINNTNDLDNLNNVFYKSYKEVLDAYMERTSDEVLSSATVGTKRIYLYSLATVIQDMNNEFKESEESVSRLLSVPGLSNSVWARTWQKDPGAREGIETSLIGVLQKYDSNAGVTVEQEPTPRDSYMMDIASVLNVKNGVKSPIFKTAPPADKTREFVISPNVMVEIGSMVDTFVNYVKDEYMAMVAAKNLIDDTILETTKEFNNFTQKQKDAVKGENDEAKIDYLVTLKLPKTYYWNSGAIKIGEKYTGSVFNYSLFPEDNNFDKAYKKKLISAKTNTPIAKTLEDAELLFQSNYSSIRDEIRGSLNNAVKVETDYLKGINNNKPLKEILLENLGPEVISAYLPNKSYSITKANANQLTGNREGKQLEEIIKVKENANREIDQAVQDMMTSFVGNSIISKVEFAKIYTGAVQNFGRLDKYIKRVPATYVDGLQMIPIEGKSTKFNVLAIEEEKVTDSVLLGMLPENVAKYYLEVDRNDAQGYITIERWKNILEGTSKFTLQAKQVYNKIVKQGEFVSQGREIPKEFRLSKEDLMVISAQPLKGVHFENKLETSPVFLKYSQAILIPEFYNNMPKARKLAEYMAKNNIDEAVATSGIKSGAPRGSALFGDNGILENPNAPRPTLLELDNRFWRLQQDLPYKGLKEAKIGTQIQKIVIEGLRLMDGIVQVDKNKNPLTGPELADRVDKALASLSDLGTKAAREELGLNPDGTIQDKEQFYKSLLKNLEKEGGETKIIEKLLEEEDLTNIPMFSSNVVVNTLNTVNRGATNLLAPGGSFIQMSDQLITAGDKKEGIVFFKEELQSNQEEENDRALNPPTKGEVMSELGNKEKYIAGQVLIPHSMMAKYLPNYHLLSPAELREAVPEELREIIGYRIPTQERASTDFLEIVGVLPAAMGDEVVAYSEITAKTGSDFDIDKMFYMMRPISNREGNVLRVDRSSGLAAAQDEAFEAFKLAMTIPGLFDKTMTSIDNPMVEESMTAFTKKESQNNDFNNYLPSTASKIRAMYLAGSKGIGDSVNAMNDAIRQQSRGIVFNIATGAWGNTEFDAKMSETISKEEAKMLADFINKRTGKTKNKYRSEDFISLEITSTLSQLTNGFVDIANKDAAITKAGWGNMMNSYGTMLVRKGIHPNKVFLMFQQPGFIEFISQINNTTSNVGEFSDSLFSKINNKPGQLVENVTKKLNEDELLYKKDGIYRLSTKSNNRDDYKALQALVSFVNSGGYALIPLDAINFKTLINDTANYVTEGKKPNSYISLLNEVVAVNHFLKLRSLGVNEAYEHNITSSKTGEAGAKRTIGDMFALRNKITNSMSFSKKTSILNYNTELEEWENEDVDLEFKDLTNKLYDKQGNLTLLGKFNSNVFGTLSTTFSDNSMFLNMGEATLDLINNLAVMYSKDGKLLTSGNKINEVIESLNYAVYSDFAPLSVSGVSYNELSSKFYKLKNKYPNNSFIQNLKFTKEKDLGSISMNRINSKSAGLKGDIRNSWLESIYSQDSELNFFAKEMVHYSYNSSAFKSGPQDFGFLIPPDYLINEGIEDYVRENIVLGGENTSDLVVLSKLINLKSKDKLSPDFKPSKIKLSSIDDLLSGISPKNVTRTASKDVVLVESSQRLTPAKYLHKFGQMYEYKADVNPHKEGQENEPYSKVYYAYQAINSNIDFRKVLTVPNQANSTSFFVATSKPMDVRKLNNGNFELNNRELDEQVRSRDFYTLKEFKEEFINTVDKDGKTVKELAYKLKYDYVVYEKSNGKDFILTGQYTRDLPKKEEYQDTAFVFTENINSIGTNLVGNGLAVVRNNPNAIGLVTKKYYFYAEQQGSKEALKIQKEYTGSGKWYDQNFEDTQEDFELFKKINTEQLNKIDKWDKRVFPKEFASGLAKLPSIRFSEWLQNELDVRYGLDSRIGVNNKLEVIKFKNLPESKDLNKTLEATFGKDGVAKQWSVGGTIQTNKLTFRALGNTKVNPYIVSEIQPTLEDNVIPTFDTKSRAAVQKEIYLAEQFKDTKEDINNNC